MSPTPFSKSSLEATAIEALDVLAAAGDRAEQLVAEWVAAGNASAVQEAALRGSGKVRKAARRGINVLRSRGVGIPPRLKAKEAAAHDGQCEAWLVPADANGIQLIAISKAQPSGSHSVCFVFFRERSGIAQVESAVMSRSRLKDSIRKTHEKSGLSSVAVPLDWARWRIAQARKTHAEAGAVEPMGFDAARPLLEPVPAAPVPHPLDVVGFDLAPADVKGLAKDSVRLHQLPEFRAWMPSRESVQQMLVELGARIGPEAKPDNDKLNEYLEAAIADATDRFFTPERRELIALQMKDAALTVRAREGDHRALEVSATAAAIEQAGLITDPPREIPFLIGFFQKVVGLMIAQGGGKLNIPIPNPALVDVPAVVSPPAGTETTTPTRSGD